MNQAENRTSGVKAEAEKQNQETGEIKASTQKYRKGTPRRNGKA